MFKKLDEYIAHLGRNKSPNTLKNYELHVGRFLDWIEDHGQMVDPFELDQDIYLDYIDDLKGNYAPKSVHAHMTAIYGWITFLHRKGYITKTPFLDTKEMNEYLPIIHKKRVRSLTKPQLKKMLFMAEGDLVCESVIRLFYDTGMRVSELVSIKITDIEHDFDRILVHTSGKGKGGMTKQRTVRITEKTYEVIEIMIQERGFESDYVLASYRTKRPFTTRRIDQMVKVIAGKSGIKDLTTHMFRKSIATHLLDEGMGTEYVAKYLGHANSATLENHYFDYEKTIHEKFDEFHVSL
jgi:site-specific recombinase XerD